MHWNGKIKSVYFDSQENTICFPEEKVENICPISFAMSNTKLNNYLFNKRLAKKVWMFINQYKSSI